MSTTICQACKRAITGRYITALGHNWHAEHFVCARCNKAIGEDRFFEKDGEPYHEACYHAAFSPRCAKCGQAITGQYVTAQGKPWHPEHFACAADGRPLNGASYYEQDGKVWCEKHYWEKFGKRCVIGGEILKGHHLVNLWGQTYCAEHQKGVPECYSCGRPIAKLSTGGGVKYGDGRTICNLCKKTAIDGVSAGQKALDAVRAEMERWGLSLGGSKTPLQLVDQPTLNANSTKGYSRQPSGMANSRTRSVNGRVTERWIESIMVLHGLPREHFEDIAAHELMHAYLLLNAYPELAPQVEEGLCRLAEHIWLTRQNTEAARIRLENFEVDKDPIYGEGYRLARVAYEKHGLAKVLAYVRKNSKLP